MNKEDKNQDCAVAYLQGIKDGKKAQEERISRYIDQLGQTADGYYHQLQQVKGIEAIKKDDTLDSQKNWCGCDLSLSRPDHYYHLTPKYSPYAEKQSLLEFCFRNKIFREVEFRKELTIKY